MDKLDILNRQEFVDNLLRFVDNITYNKSATCFALNGVWGSGKSFVLDMFEEKLSQVCSDDSKEKYFIIRYNCWKYDYYEEPLIAIVSAIISAIEEKTKLFPDSETRSAIVGMLKAAGVSLFSILNTVIKEKTGVDIQTAYKIVVEGEKEGIEKYEKEHAYDAYLNFNEVINSLSNLLQDIAEKYTVIIIVDELDRCLPEYAIKVLERMHHLTEEKSNIVTMVAIDKKQLEYSVKQIFGFDNPAKYLEKFFDFEIRLDTGAFSKRIIEKYSDYIKLFDKNIFCFDDSVEECLQAIFKDIDIRTQEHIVNKAMLTHKLLFKDTKDYSFMCMELIIAVMKFVYNYEDDFYNQSIEINNFENVFAVARIKLKPAFSSFFKEKFDLISFTSRSMFPDAPVSYILPSKPSLYGAIIFSWYWMHKKSSSIVISHARGDVYDVISKNHEELNTFLKTINMIG